MAISPWYSRRLWLAVRFFNDRKRNGPGVDYLDSFPRNRNPPLGGTDTLVALNESPSFSTSTAERDGMSDLIEFRHFKYLIAVAEEKNISRAAKRLFLAQPSLSIQLKSIEDALSIELLVRVPKGVKLTPAAEVLIAGARQILALRDEVVAAARASHHGTIAPLRIGFSPFIDCALLQMVCSAHIALFPNCEITPKSGDSVELLSMLERGLSWYVWRNEHKASCGHRHADSEQYKLSASADSSRHSIAIWIQDSCSVSFRCGKDWLSCHRSRQCHRFRKVSGG
jgi:Bacterial regulatory helix-turn-helix protein, lysR family